MLRHTKLTATTSLFTLGLAVASAQALHDESRIRQADQQTQVTGFAWYPVFFTISGYSSESIVTPFYCGPLGSAPGVIERVNHSSGQISYRFCVTAQPGRNWCVVDLWRNGCLVVGDRIRVF